MAKKHRATFAKREKERARQEKQALKRERRQGRGDRYDEDGNPIAPEGLSWEDQARMAPLPESLAETAAARADSGAVGGDSGTSAESSEPGSAVGTVEQPAGSPSEE